MNWLGLTLIIGGAIALAISIIWIRAEPTEKDGKQDNAYPGFYKVRLISVFIIAGLIMLIMGTLSLLGYSILE